MIFKAFAHFIIHLSKAFGASKSVNIFLVTCLVFLFPDNSCPDIPIICQCEIYFVDQG